MNTRIYYLDKYLEFTDAVPQNSLNKNITVLRSGDPGKPSWKQVAADFCNARDERKVILAGFDFEKTLESLLPYFHFIQAAGGLIERDGTWLFIRRHDRWDLPKGKLEKNEPPETGAIRECEEECAVKDLHIMRHLRPTFHVYPYKSGFALKRTHWYYMTTGYRGNLTPQIEEHITEVKWFDRKAVHSIVLADTYYTIADVVNEAITG